MARRIYRDRVTVGAPPAEVEMGPGPVLHVDAITLGAAHPGAQHAVDLWWEHDDAVPQVTRTFVVVGTGHLVPEGALHRGTTDRTPAGLVWHLYELEAADG